MNLFNQPVSKSFQTALSLNPNNTITDGTGSLLRLLHITSSYTSQYPGITDINECVGIFNDTPTFTLDVNGTINWTGDLYHNENKVLTFNDNYNSTALGFCSYVTGDNSTALGYGSYVTGDNSTALGYGSIVNGDNLVAMGTSYNPISLSINNSNPQYTLDVNGSINFTGNLRTNGTAGLTFNQTFKDDSGTTKTMHITNGLITSIT